MTYPMARLEANRLAEERAGALLELMPDRNPFQRLIADQERGPPYGTTVEQAREATGWPLRVAEDVEDTEPPTDEELRVLRELRATLEAAA